MNLTGSLLMGQLWGRATGNYLTENSSVGSGLNGYGLSGLTGTPYMSFASALQKAAGRKQTFREGEDVVMGFPPAGPANYEPDESKDVSEMTLDEYKRYICNKISRLPVSDSARLNTHGVLVLKEEAFVSMQKDPAYEEKILNMLQKGFQTQYSFYSPNIGYQVIGGSEQECYGEGVPIRSSSAGLYAWKRSRWDRRHEGLQEDPETGRRESLAERLEKNRAGRLQERISGKALMERSGS